MGKEMKLLIRFLIWKLKRDYGTCETKDTDDFPELKKSMCPSCRCKEVIEFLEEYVKPL